MAIIRSPRRRITVLFDARAGEAGRVQGGSEDTARQVVDVLGGRGFDTVALGVDDDLEAMAKALEIRRPELVFNLVERFANNVQLRPDVAAGLELLGLPFTGAGPAGLHLATDAALTARVLASYGVPMAVGEEDEPTVTVAILGNETAQLLPDSAHASLVRAAQHALRLRDYALVSIRGVAIVRAVPNPSLGPQDELPRLARAAGVSYEALLERILDEALARFQVPETLSPSYI